MYVREWQSRANGRTLRVESEIEPVMVGGLAVFRGVTASEEVREYPDIEFVYRFVLGKETWIVSTERVCKMCYPDGTRISSLWLSERFLGPNLAVFKAEPGTILMLRDRQGEETMVKYDPDNENVIVPA